MKLILIKYFFLLWIFHCTIQYSFTQEVVVFGVIREIDSEKPIDFARVFIENTSKGVESDGMGNYSLKIPANKVATIVFSRLGYDDIKSKLEPMAEGSKRYLNILMVPSDLNLNIEIRAGRIDDGGMVREEVTEFKMLPTASGNFESILPHIALGLNAGTGGELSSQYNVRGGNYDENLIYVNDFEIFRPQLIRAGQQEGLSFANTDMIRDLTFSSGGYEAKYGDKMSSVLDVRYKRAEQTKASVSLGFLGINANLEGSKRLGPNAYNKLRYLIGSRYKTSKYILGSLDVKGEYIPDFYDLQSYLTYDITKDIQIGWIGNYNSSSFAFSPAERRTALGLITYALQLTSVFEGGEKDKFVNAMSGLALTYVPEGKKHPIFFKFLSSIYGSSEQENFDILGYYRLSQIETNFGSDDYGNEIAVLGIGTQHNYARNYLYNRIFNVEHKGGIELSPDHKNSAVNSHFIQWGIKYQQELFDDELNEWERLDSAGYSIPYTGKEVGLQTVLKTKNTINNSKSSAFVEDIWTLNTAGNSQWVINAGIRAAHHQLNDEFIVSPRLILQYMPSGKKSNIVYKISGGTYYQAPFYREMRKLDGTVNTGITSQKSTHIVAGITKDFKWNDVSNKPFKLISEVYYKRFYDLISYEVDNVKIRYSGINDATGYAAGLDLRINGEFVPGAESWVNLSFLKTGEALNGVQHKSRELGDTVATNVNYVARPTDRFATVNLFFQDYLPKNKNIKANVNISFGTGLPFGRKDDNIEYRNTYRYKAYHRVDIGFSFMLWDEARRKMKPHHPLRFCRNSWVSIEVFNLLQVANVASNTWIKTITNSQYAIPNNLTSRRINLKFRMDF